MDSATPFQPWAAKDGAKNVKAERELVDDAKSHRENVNHPKHTQTASYDKESVSCTSSNPGPSGGGTLSTDTAKTQESKMDSGKIASMQQIVENTLSHEGRQRVAQLLEAVEALSGAERLLLYLRLPTGVPPHDPLKQPINPLGSRAELQQTVTWIQTHLEVDPDVSLPKQDVYDEYIAHCMSSNMKPLSTADFGKVMKQVYPSVRPRRLGTRGNSRYCYAGLRKKIKLEVPQLPDLGDTSKDSTGTSSRETERIICDWAETKLGVKCGSILELSRHIVSGRQAPPPPAVTPPLAPVLTQVPSEDPTSRQLLKQLKRKIQTHGTPGRPKKNKAQEAAGDSPPSTSSYVHQQVKHEGEMLQEGYPYQPAYVPVYDVRPPYPYAAPPRAHPPPLVPHQMETYAYQGKYAPHDLTVPADTAHNVPINLSSDASLDLSTERSDWQRRRPPEPPPAPARLPLPGKKLILETYQSESQASSLRTAQPDPRPLEEFPRTEYLPKKMRAAEIMGGKLAAARQALAGSEAASSSTAAPESSVRSEAAFLEDPKNGTSRSKSTAAALAREEQEAASPTRSVKAPTPKCERSKSKRAMRKRARASSASPDSCCGLDGINIKTGMICEEKHSEILNRERVISICNIDKHDLDDYLNEGNSQEHEEELLQYFHQRNVDPETAAGNHADFLETSLDPHDEHSQGNNEKISQLRELLAKNLKNQSGSNVQNMLVQEPPRSQDGSDEQTEKAIISEGAFKSVAPNGTEAVSGPNLSNQMEASNEKSNILTNVNGTFTDVPASNSMTTNVGGSHIYNGNCQNVPQSPTTRTQQYDFVPISDRCHSPVNYNSKSPMGYDPREHSPSKTNKLVMMGGSLQSSPISHSTAASPFVSPRNTPVPRSRLCPRPVPKHNGRRRRNPLALAVTDTCPKQFAIPADLKFSPKTSSCVSTNKYYQPMSAPPSPNTQYKNQMFHCAGVPNGHFLHNSSYRENNNGDLAQPLSADPLSSEVSQFFQESLHNYRPEHEALYRSQSAPLKQGLNNLALLSYNNTPVGSVPPTPVPNEFCDFGSLNPETLDKIYDAIDSSSDVLNTGPSRSLLNSNNMSNGCDSLPEQQILTDEQLNSLIPSDPQLIDRRPHFSQTTYAESAPTDNVDDFLKRANSMEFDLSHLVTEKSKYCTSRSVPSTPLPFKRMASNLEIDPRRSRELFATENYTSESSSISSKSVPSTPQIAEGRSFFSYSNRDFLINGNSVDMCGATQMQDSLVDNSQPMNSPLHDMLREDMLEPLTPAADLLADLDKIDGTPYVDI